MAWVVASYSPGVETDVLSLPDGLLARFVRYAERMEALGPDLGMPYTRALGDGMFELRLKATEGIARVFYCTVVGRRIVFPHSFVKKTQKTPKSEMTIARRRMKEVRDD